MRTVYHGLYRLGLTPWDTAAIPAPLADAVEGPAALPPGRALDLGCGTGHQARYLAAHGWTVTAVDIVGKALSVAGDRDSNALQRRPLIDWRLADVTRLREVDPDDRLAATMTLLLDNGCLHGIPDAHRPGWA